MRFLPVLVAALSLATGAQAASTSQPSAAFGASRSADSMAVRPFLAERFRGGWALAVDNDFLTFADRDHDYTGGVSLMIAGDDLRGWRYSPGAVLDRLEGLLPGVGSDDVRRLDALQIGVMAFTPENLRDPAPQPLERPYASLVFATASRTSVGDPGQPVHTTSLTVGLLGLEVAKALQRSVHKGLGQTKIPQGWAHQISAGGEPTLRLGWSRESLLASRALSERSRGEIKWRADVSLGYLTEAGIGISGRIGLIDSPWWGFHADQGDYMSQGAPMVGSSSRDVGEVYVWAGAKLRLRAYNALLQGQFRSSEVTVPESRLRNVLGEISAGITWQFSSRWRLSYVARYQTPEIGDGPGNRDLLWAGLVLSRGL